MELEVQGLEVLQSAKIRSNFLEVKKYLADELLTYKGLVVTPETISGAKSARANIRKIATRIDDQRKAVKTAYMVPFTEFENEMKELKGMCDEVAQNIDAQVKAFDDSAKAEREQKLRELFTDKAADLIRDELCSWEQIFNPRWVNATYGETKAADELIRSIAKIRGEVNAIRTLEEGMVPILLNEYGRTHDFARVLMLKSTLEQRKAEEAKRAEQKRIAEEARRKAESQPKAEAIPTEEPTAAQTPSQTAAASQSEADPREEIYELSFKVTATVSQLVRLKAFFKENGIKYEKI